MSEKRPDLDHLLDRGLEAWAESEPAPGLEERVLERLRREPETTPLPEEKVRRWPWILLAAAALLTAVGGSVLFRSEPPRAATESVTTTRPAPAAERVVTRLTAPEAERPARIIESAVPAVKTPRRKRPPSPPSVREVFPTPSPLGAEDRLLLAYVASTPLDEMQNHFGLLDPPAEETEGTKENR